MDDASCNIYLWRVGDEQEARLCDSPTSAKAFKTVGSLAVSIYKPALTLGARLHPCAPACNNGIRDF
jgi:hypothetical protein